MDVLPGEVLALVLLFLDEADHRTVAPTCRRWRRILGDAALFRWTCEECKRTFPRLEPSREAPWYREWGRVCGECAGRPEVLQVLPQLFSGLRVYWKCYRPDLVKGGIGFRSGIGCQCQDHLYPDQLGRLVPFIVVCPNFAAHPSLVADSSGCWYSPPVQRLMTLFAKRGYIVPHWPSPIQTRRRFSAHLCCFSSLATDPGFRLPVTSPLLTHPLLVAQCLK